MLAQTGNNAIREQLLQEYQPFVKKNVSSVCKRYITKSDDEFSIGLQALNQSIDQFVPEKGASFLSFSEVLIKRRVIDYIRKEQRHQHLPYTRVGDEEESGAVSMEASISVQAHTSKMETNARKEEIRQFVDVLQEYGITFNELTSATPKHRDARENAIDVAKLIVQRDDLLSFVREKKKLPLKKLAEEVDQSRKTLERNRKYIISMVLLLIGDYPYLQDYVKGVREA
ncbi:RNA polymerase sigma-I factor [Bacillus fonticola]|uniref:RNA polymerase sigma-I factor n=1 Tax=Bacillus fonticola TaxID=2728853 RepID=UPI0014731C6F|nr:RNA polymerase sigma-I factor [Bacillus fonticola]